MKVAHFFYISVILHQKIKYCQDQLLIQTSEKNFSLYMECKN